jgi:hypothetical protein
LRAARGVFGMGMALFLAVGLGLAPDPLDGLGYSR